MTSSLPIWHRAKLGAVRLVRNRRKGTLTYVQKGGNQSAVDENGVSLDSYIHALYGLALQALARQGQPKTALMIGCAGGTLATMLARAGVAMTVVDIEKAAFTLAKTHFGLPASVKCRVADGLKFMQRTRARFDAVIIDAFIGEKIPPQFTGEAFSTAARRCLRKNGALFVNVCLNGRADRTADELALMLKGTGWAGKGSAVRLIDQRGPLRNAVVMAGNVRALRRPRLVVPPAQDRKRLRYELKGMKFRKILASSNAAQGA
ncbi:MAG: methyltransferase domain-containing protein [Rhodospirillaceae bacterium]|nr:methyltransferase domain-containing protein [Rhodospirillaceae bacterium]